MVTMGRETLEIGGEFGCRETAALRLEMIFPVLEKL
jgi:hypothetical protein